MLHFTWSPYAHRTHESFLCEWMSAVPVPLWICGCICFWAIFSSTLCETYAPFLWPQNHHHRCWLSLLFYSWKKVHSLFCLFIEPAVLQHQQDIKTCCDVVVVLFWNGVMNCFVINIWLILAKMDTFEWHANEIWIWRNFSFPGNATIQNQMQKMSTRKFGSRWAPRVEWEKIQSLSDTNMKISLDLKSTWKMRLNRQR